MIVRDLVTRLGLRVDGKGFKQADKGIAGLKTSLGGLAVAFGAVLGARGFGKLVTLASDAQETLNVIGESFKENAQGVQDWAAVVSREVGRSEFRLLEMAGQLGALLTPSLEGNAAASAEMSKSLAKLSVDLGSFFNVSDNDALLKIRAGLVGSTEPLLAFGVNLQVAALEQFRLNQGIKTSVKNMTQAEKVTLRYQKIMFDTANAQGDAARTADGFANASKAVQDAVRDVATRIGLAALPAIERMTVSLREGIQGFQQLVQGGKLAEGILFAVAAAALILGVNMLVAFAAPLATALGLIVALAAIALVAEDIMVLFAGGRSAIGDFIDETFGLGAADNFVRDHRAGVEQMAQAWTDAEGSIIDFGLALAGIDADIPAVSDTLTGLGASAVDLGNQIVISIVGAFAKVLNAASNLSILPDALQAQLKVAAGGLQGAIGEFRFENTQRAGGRGTGGAGQLTESRFQGRRREARSAFLARRDAKAQRRRGRDSIKIAEEGLRALEGKRGAAAERARRKIRSEIGQVEEASGLASQSDLAGGIGRGTGRGIGAGAERVRFGRAQAPSTAAAQVIQDNRIDLTIDGTGQSPEEILAQVNSMIIERDERNRRKAKAGLRQTAPAGG